MVATASTHLDESYRHCEAVARGSNFYTGFRLLPAPKRRALSAVYAFMRQCDDISDSEGGLAEKRKQFARWRTMFEEAMRDGRIQDPTLPALRDTVQSFRIPAGYFLQLIDGTEMDLTITRYATFDDLYRYCYHVASVVGLVSIRIFGFRDPQAETCAEACGLAFQLTNILRDVKEDLERDRVYLPGEDLRRFGYTENDLRRGVIDERFRDLMAFEAARARRFYAEAEPLFKLIDPDSRPALRAMYESYHTILRRIEQRNYDVLGERVRLKRREKVRIGLRALLQR